MSYITSSTGSDSWLDASISDPGNTLWMDGWFKLDTLSGFLSLLGLFDSATAAQRYNLIYQGGLKFQCIDPSSTTATANVATHTAATDTWYYVCGLVNGLSSFTAGVDGHMGLGTEDTTTLTEPTFNTITFGRTGDSTPTGALDGHVADVALFTVIPTKYQINMRAGGVDARHVGAGSNLINYWPLVDNLNDVVGGVTLTNNNSCAQSADHPTIFRPKVRLVA